MQKKPVSVSEGSAAVATRVAKGTDLIMSDSEIMGGTPVFKGTRVPVDNLISWLEDGYTIDDYLYSFPSVSKEQLIAVLRLAYEWLVTQAK
jgi:uncharacterized protein (DUF433 family)